MSYELTFFLRLNECVVNVTCMYAHLLVHLGYVLTRDTE